MLIFMCFAQMDSVPILLLTYNKLAVNSIF